MNKEGGSEHKLLECLFCLFFAGKVTEFFRFLFVFAANFTDFVFLLFFVFSDNVRDCPPIVRPLSARCPPVSAVLWSIFLQSGNLLIFCGSELSAAQIGNLLTFVDRNSAQRRRKFADLCGSELSAAQTETC